MRLKDSKWTCVLFAIILLLSLASPVPYNDGMSFSTASNKTSSSHLHSADTSTLTVQACTTEMLGIPQAASTGRIDSLRNREKRDTFTSLPYWQPCNASVSDSIISTYSEKTPTYSRRLNELITHYIHNSDGKKKI